MTPISARPAGTSIVGRGDEAFFNLLHVSFFDRSLCLFKIAEAIMKIVPWGVVESRPVCFLPPFPCDSNDAKRRFCAYVVIPYLIVWFLSIRPLQRFNLHCLQPFTATSRYSPPSGSLLTSSSDCIILIAPPVVPATAPNRAGEKSEPGQGGHFRPGVGGFIAVARRWFCQRETAAARQRRATLPGHRRRSRPQGSKTHTIFLLSLRRSVRRRGSLWLRR